MEQNNFEKNVQQKMDELKIAPSESVWTNVEKRIGKKDKNRRLIFIIFFLFLFLLSGGYWLINSSKNNQKNNQQISNVIKKESHGKSTNNEDSSFQKQEINSQKNTGNKDVTSVLSKKIKSTETKSENIKEKVKEPKHGKLIAEITAKQVENYGKARNNEDSDFELNNQITPKMLEKENENFADKSNENIEDKIDVDSISTQVKSENPTEKIIANNNSGKKKDSTKKDKNRWNIGFTFSGGESSISTNPLKASYPVADYLSMPQGGIPSYYYYQPSPIKNSTAFVAGIFIEKNISKRGKISFGLSYKYYSLVNKVGIKIDSLLSPSMQYYNVSNPYSSIISSHNYRNNFHYLELPLSFELRLNKNKKLPLSWNAGINISELISSNALQFKSNPGVYYNDNSLFNKTQFGLGTGLSLTLFSQQKMPFTFGPYFYYSATSLADNGLYARKHFNFIGIRTEILFKKK